MFPFESRWRWITSTGYLHIVEAIRAHIDAFEEPYDEILRDRARRTETALRVRFGVLVLLNLGVVATVLAYAARFVPLLAELRSLVTTVASSLAGLSLLLTGVFLLLSRYLGQLQADMLSSMALGTPGGPAVGPTVDERREESRDSKPGGNGDPKNS